MNKKLLILGLLFVLGAIAIFAVAQRYFGSVEQEAENKFTSERNIQEVLVYSRPLARGVKLRAADMSWQERMGENIPSSAILKSSGPDYSRFENQILLRDVDFGDFVSDSHMLSGSAGYMSLAINPNLRAFAINASDVQLVGGFVEPGDRVDIVHTVVRDLDGDGRQNGISDFIIKNARVLAVGAEPLTGNIAKAAQPESSEISKPDAIKADTVTLELTEGQIIQLSAAMTSGGVSLALRPIINNPDGPPTFGGQSTIQQEAGITYNDEQAASVDLGQNALGGGGTQAGVKTYNKGQSIRIISNISERDQAIN